MVVHFPLKALTLALSAALFLTACDNSDEVQTQAPAEQAAGEAVVEAVENDNESQASAAASVDSAAVAKHYADLAHATYKDAATTAQALNEAVDALISEPTEANLAAAKQAWLDARVAYQQSEVFRFGNAVVDDWEGQLNAWPLDEGMIDYVAADDYQHEMGNEGATANIIANTSINIGGETLDVSDLTPELLADLNEIGGSEANVATGYHAIEFLLWGQDLNGYAAGSGERPVTDYASNDACTNGHCDRRAEYLDAVTDLLVTDLQWMTEQWAEDQSGNSAGNYRAELLAMPSEDVMQKMLFGMGSLSLGELAGERMKVALEANSYEDEHDCFSDNTHNSHFYNAKGIQNVYLGEYQPTGGNVMTGPSLSALVAQSNPELDQQLRAELESTMAAVQAMKDAAEAEDNPMAFDMMIAPDNQQGHEIINAAINALVIQTGSIEKVAGELGLASLEPDDAGHAF
ncbi:imelysin family protein [Halopseudomonas pelagia]|uniref:imelysin family protein n=1 Tax=Halopseudomonas pelagia TaxID=553151 RepID=UPI00039C58A0|nr:imelysin family protein [Halopseudomonas pelagia]|tara:strand:+ start:292 stop:1677 length:1386 start_codon:yes stop_codon:yes gene_type:complete